MTHPAPLTLLAALLLALALAALFQIYRLPQMQIYLSSFALC